MSTINGKICPHFPSHSLFFGASFCCFGHPLAVKRIVLLVMKALLGQTSKKKWKRVHRFRLDPSFETIFAVYTHKMDDRLMMGQRPSRPDPQTAKANSGHPGVVRRLRTAPSWYTRRRIQWCEPNCQVINKERQGGKMRAEVDAE
jgi:hypothetical protein